MASFKTADGITFNLPDEGTIFRGSNGDTNIYKIVNGQLQTDAGVGGRSGANHYAMQNGLPMNNGFPLNWDSFPQFNIADIQTSIQKLGGRLPQGDVSQVVDPTNPNATNTLNAQGQVISQPNAPGQPGAITPGATPQSNVNPNAPNPITGGYQPPNTPTSMFPNSTGGATSGSGTGSSGSGTGGFDLSQLPPEFQNLYSQLETYLSELQKRGQVLNPNIDLTPDKVAEFLHQAEGEINPYYAGQLKLAKNDLLRSVGYSEDQLLANEQQTQRDYTKGLRNIGDTSADQGFAQSGIRNKQEGDLATNANTSLTDGRRQLAFNTGTAMGNFAQKYGTGELPQFNFGEAPQASAGEGSFSQSTRQLPLYSLSPETYDGLIGSQEYARRGAVSSRSSQLESAFRGNQAINQQRQLTL